MKYNNKNNAEFTEVSLYTKAVMAAKSLEQIEAFLVEADKDEFMSIHEKFIDPLRMVIQHNLGIDAYYSILEKEDQEEQEGR